MTDWTAFKAWLARQGAEVIAPTNPYELVRFRARSATHVIYEGRRGVSAAGFAAECLGAFRTGKPLAMGLAKVPRTPAERFVAALLQRDGDACFYCLGEMRPGDITLEHLVPVSKGGPNHLSNMALAHAACNREAGDLPLVKKIERRCRAVVRCAAESGSITLNIGGGAYGAPAASKGPDQQKTVTNGTDAQQQSGRGSAPRPPISQGGRP